MHVLVIMETTFRTIKILSGLILFFGSLIHVSASHMTGSYQVIPTYSSYTYTVGCNTYRYDPYYKTSTWLYSTCSTTTYSYEYYYPTYSYSSYDYDYSRNPYYRCPYTPYPAINWFECSGGTYGYTYDYYTGGYYGGNYGSCYYDMYGYYRCY